MEPLTKRAFVAALNRMITTFDEQMEALSRMDAAIGDGDHGISMARGFHSVADRLPPVADQDIGTIAEMVGSSLTGVIGGATGPVFGTLFTELAFQAKGREELSVADLAQAFRRALDAIQAIGQAKVGDKTMVDALTPMVAALERAAGEGAGMDNALEMALRAAEGGRRSTAQLKATKGRARYLGEKSIGHEDPGAASFVLIVRSLLEGFRAGRNG
jgi:dihydroxyacetone kinase-like protein